MAILSRPRRGRLTLAAVLLLAGLAGLATYLAWSRYSDYRALLSYAPETSYQYDLVQARGQRCTVELKPGGFLWPAAAEGWDTAFLQLRVRSSWLGRWLDPYVETGPAGARQRQYFERGASGVRYLNLSHWAGPRPAAGAWVALEGSHLDWPAQTACLTLFHNPTLEGARILVIAPHPDDAEIAAFGLYAHRDAYVVTITAGEGGRALPEVEPELDPGRLRQLKGRLRVWDSLTVPLLGGLALERTCNLGYADQSLTALHAGGGRGMPVSAGGGPIPAPHRRSPAGPGAAWQPAAPERATWAGLVGDLSYILIALRPDIVVTPHPRLDGHPDHRQATLALLDAMRRAGRTSGYLFLYTNHPVLSEMAPFGEENSLVTLPPWLQRGWLFSSLYSLPLTPQTQVEKYFALEAMHDLRPNLPALAEPWAYLRAGLVNAYQELTGLDAATSYFRRAVRGNELFFLVPADQALERLDPNQAQASSRPAGSSGPGRRPPAAAPARPRG